MPVNTVAQQLNSVAMAVAGAERIFKLMDEQPEQDNGYVTLVNAKYENGELRETARSYRTLGLETPPRGRHSYLYGAQRGRALL